jgi:hypothetical protein
MARNNVNEEASADRYRRWLDRDDPIKIAADLVRRSDKKSKAGANCIMALLKRIKELEAKQLKESEVGR